MLPRQGRERLLNLLRPPSPRSAFLGLPIRPRISFARRGEADSESDLPVARTAQASSVLRRSANCRSGRGDAGQFSDRSGVA